MILRTVSSKNTTLYYVQKSFRQENGKNATKYVERLGNLEQLKARFGEDDPIGEAKKYVAELTKLDSEVYADELFCRERWIKTKLSKTGEELEQRIIVTFSFKYRDYLRHVREKQIARAESIIKRGVAGKYGKGQNDPKRFIKGESCTIDGEMAEYTSYTLNQALCRT